MNIVRLYLTAALVLAALLCRESPAQAARHWGVVAYVKSGDVYVKDLPDGAARRLTTDGRNIWPQWSPDGHWLTFKKLNQKGDIYSDGHLWFIARDGSQIHQTKVPPYTSCFSWSPRSTAVVYTNENEIRVLSVPVWRESVLLKRRFNSTFGEVAWSPDGRRIAFTRHQHFDVPVMNDTSHDYEGTLWCMDSDGRHRRKLYTSQIHNWAPVMPGWSPNSDILLFWTMVYYPASSINADGVPLCEVRLRDGKVRGLAGRRVWGSVDSLVLHERDFYAFTRDGKRLAIAAGAGRFLVDNKWLLVYDYATGRHRRLTSPRVAATYPAWSLDGRQLAYDALTDRGESGGIWQNQLRTRLWLMDARGRHQRCLTPHQKLADGPSQWLADNRHILFVRYDADENGSLWTITSSGHELKRVVPQCDDNDSRERPYALWLSAHTGR